MMFGFLQSFATLSLRLPSVASTTTTLILTRGRAFLGGRTVIVKAGHVEGAVSKLRKITQAEGLLPLWKATRHTRRGQEKRLQVKDNIRRKMKDDMRQKVASILSTKTTGLLSFQSSYTPSSLSISLSLFLPLPLQRIPSSMIKMMITTLSSQSNLQRVSFFFVLFFFFLFFFLYIFFGRLNEV
jgi:hypothetical protein